MAAVPRSALAQIPPAVLLRVPGCEEGQLPDLARRLPGGSGANKSIRIDTARGRFVLRLPVALGQRAGVDRQRELRLQRWAAAAGLAPAVLDADARAGWLLMEYVDQPVWTVADLQSPNGLKALMARIHQLQQLPVSGEEVFDAESLLDRQLSLSAVLEPGWEQPLRGLLRASAGLLRDCAVRPGTQVVAHGDLDVGNLLGPAPLLIDWEYAQVADPLHDVACLIAYYPALRQRSRRMLALLHRDTREERERLDCQIRLWGLINGLWKSLHGR